MASNETWEGLAKDKKSKAPVLRIVDRMAELRYAMSASCRAPYGNPPDIRILYSCSRHADCLVHAAVAVSDDRRNNDEAVILPLSFP